MIAVDPLSPTSMPEFVTLNVSDDNAGNKSSACDKLEPWTLDVTAVELVEFITLVIVGDEILEEYLPPPLVLFFFFVFIYLKW